MLLLQRTQLIEKALLFHYSFISYTLRALACRYARIMGIFEYASICVSTRITTTFAHQFGKKIGHAPHPATRAIPGITFR